jgi:phospholipid/cholesterol/gamma-HCH transport system permease protein
VSEPKRNPVATLGAHGLALARYTGGMSLLLGETLRWTGLGLFTPKVRFGWGELAVQLVRVGIRSIGIVAMVQGFIGVILSLQLSPTLSQYGQEAQISSIIGVGGFRMLGPIFTAVVLSGFAGASIAAELGTMVVSEEIEAMEAMALPPVRFLIVPRVGATFIAMVLLTGFADLMIALGGWFISLTVLGPDVYNGYWDRMRDAMNYSDFLTGLIQAGVFGVLIGLIACFEGLRVRGGASGVGRATTNTVVFSIVAIVLAASVCTVIFYVFNL